MAISMIGVSIGRDTEIATLLEAFIDEHKEDLSLTMINALEEVTGDVDKQVQQLLDEKAELELELEKANQRIEELEEEAE